MPTMDISELATWGPNEFKRWGEEINARRLALTKSIGFVSLTKVGNIAGVTNTTVGEAEKGKPKELKTVVGIMDALDNLERQARAARGESEPVQEAKVVPLPTQSAATAAPEQVSETARILLEHLEQLTAIAQTMSNRLAAVEQANVETHTMLREIRALVDQKPRRGRQTGA